MQQLQKNYDEETELRFGVKRRLDVLTSKRVHRTTVSDGEARLRKLEWIVEHGFQSSRYAFDRLLHGLMIRALAEMVVGSDWNIIGPTIIRDRGWTHMSKLVIGKAPRRFGKTWANSKMGVALCEVMLLSQGALKDGQTFTISIFSTGKRASNGFKQAFMQFLTERDMMDYIESNAAERLELHQRRGDPTSPKIIVNFFPSKAST